MHPKLLLSAALCFQGITAFAQLKPCELQSELAGLHEKAKVIQTQVADGTGAIKSHSTLKLDDAGRPLSLSVEDAAGNTFESTTWSYGLYGTTGSVTHSSDPSKAGKCVVDYASGQVLEVYTVGSNGVVAGRVLFDLTQNPDKAVTRTISFHSQNNFEFNQKGRFDAHDGHLTNTGLISNGHEVGVWTIRHKNKGVVRDEVQFADLSFSKREFHPDGTFFVHDFSSQSRTHTFAWYRSDSQPSRVFRRSPTEDTQTHYSYDGSGRVVSIRQTSEHNQDITTFEYTDNPNGDWTTRLKKVNGQIVETASRTVVE